MESMTERTRTYLAPVLERLRAETSECRGDMHEPEEQGLEVLIRGDHLDNAMGADPRSNGREFTVGISTYGSAPVWFNFADLIALARRAELG